MKVAGCPGCCTPRGKLLICKLSKLFPSVSFLRNSSLAGKDRERGKSADKVHLENDLDLFTGPWSEVLCTVKLTVKTKNNTLQQHGCPN